MLRAALVCAVLSAANGFVSPRSALYHRPRTYRTSRGPFHLSPTGDWALVFDCDGVILESENLHREAYNAVFREFSVPYAWSEEYYDDLQNKVGGGKPKMRYYFDLNGWPVTSLGPPPESAEAKDALLDTLQDRKTDIYKDFVRGGTAELRPGILRLINEALSFDSAAVSRPKLAICSASTKSACIFVLENLLGDAMLEKFDLLLAGDDVPRRKPDPMIYALACERLAVPPERCIVIEDSLIGLQAATGAGIKCVVTYTPSTKSQDFSAAVVVYPDLGDDDAPRVTVASLHNMMMAAPAPVPAVA